MKQENNQMHEMNHHMSNSHDMHSEDEHMNSSHHMMMDMGELYRKLWISLILTVPVLLLSSMAGMHYATIRFPGSPIVLFVIGSILYFYGGQPFFSGAKGELMNKRPGMMALITMGITVAYGYSVYAVISNDLMGITPKVDEFFWELATLIDIMLIGHIIEMKSIDSAGSAVDSLAKLLPDTARVKRNGSFVEAKLQELVTGDIVQVRSGESIPADGTIVSGETTINEALVTGESQAISKTIGSQVIGGSINNDGTIEYRVDHIGEDSYLNKVQRLVANASESKSNAQTLADKVAGYLFYAALTIAIVAFVVWVVIGGLNKALPIAVTVLIIACPHALGLAIPLVISRSTGIAAKHGLLIRSSRALEVTKKVKYVLMDKTGTLTEGQFKLNEHRSMSDNYTDDEILQLSAGLEETSSHPLAKGVLAAFDESGLSQIKMDNIQQIPGYGVAGKYNGHEYKLVSVQYFESHNLEYDRQLFDELAGGGSSVSFLLDNEEPIGAIAEGDKIKPASKKLVDYLLQQGITPVMLTGDNQKIADQVANKLGIKDVRAQLLPEDKEKMVMEFQKRGVTAFVGDGVNDAPSLSRADVAVAIGSGTDVAIDSADVVLVNSNPQNIIDFIELAIKTSRKMIQNLWWGAGYNIIALPLAAGILAPIGILLNPMVGAVLMSLSTVVVALNALTLKV
ncbi:copper-translocating P-type ATPase [Lentilactobacillus sp. Marseille-Q4993]|uniref:copper-translocating P-type ATPase n=1 Tax=Lentilactobacillus sp. Marseille-Q4993 TaxID=3039492 RepID=UPI0024BC1C10|nr:copper-translocating P-type ATPase [Lentilactobacillus sp. Marseille-Q4993]